MPPKKMMEKMIKASSTKVVYNYYRKIVCGVGVKKQKQKRGPKVTTGKRVTSLEYTQEISKTSSKKRKERLCLILQHHVLILYQQKKNQRVKKHMW